MGLTITRQVLDTFFRAPNAMPWGWPCTINSHDGWIGHGNDYQDSLTMWIIPMAMAGQDLKAAVEKGGLVQEILDAATGA